MALASASLGHMRVLVTGGSGFVGSYTVAALLEAGHRPRLLVRDPGRTTKVLAEVGVGADLVEFYPGDMLDKGAVDQALDGCDAVIHAAAALGVTSPRDDLVTVNVTGTRNVVGGAVERGLDPVIYVSTIAVFVPPAGPVITADGPLASPRTDYGRSKVIAERYVRDLQDGGAPVTIVYPGGVLGPYQPSLDAMMEGLAGALGTAWPMPRGGVAVVDVRDLAEALTRALVPGSGARRFPLGGHFLTWPGFADLCDKVTGVRCRRIVVPGSVMLALGTALDRAKRIHHFDYPLTRDAAEIMVTMVPTDDSATIASLGLRLRPVEESVTDALRWLAKAGHLSGRRAGLLAPNADVSTKERPMTIVQTTLGPLFQRIAGSAWFRKVGPKTVPPLDRVLNRLSGGRLLLSQALVPSIVLTTTGSSSGLPRKAPLACLPEPDGAFVVVGSNFGREKHPAWSSNLLHEPAAEVGFRGRTIPVTARLLEGAERAEVWPRLIQVWPVYDRYVESSGRALRVFRLTPRVSE